MFSHAFTLTRSLWMVLILALLPLHIQAVQPSQALQTRASEDTVLVKFKPGVAADSKRSAHTQAQGNVRNRIESIGVDVVQVPKGSVSAAIALYSNNPNVVYAEPSYIRPLYLPATNEGSEPGLGVTQNFNEQYSLQNSGKPFGVTTDSLGLIVYPAYQGSANADIKWQGAIDFLSPPDTVKVAVLDSGVDCNHLDLSGPDKCTLYNFVGHRGSGPEDVIGHGTHVAGIIAATVDNGVGIAGVAPNAQISSMKVCWEDTSLILFGIVSSQCEDADIIAALDYIINTNKSGLQQPYKVINLSLAGPTASQSLHTAIDEAWQAGLVIVGAAGNAYNTVQQYIPAKYSNVIGVGATDYHDNLAPYSNFGSWVSVLAPGSVILSTVPGAACGQPANEPSDCYDYKSGTSMATPLVSGIAAVVAGYFPDYSNAEIRAAIEGSANPIGALGQNFQAWSLHGRVNLLAALNYSAEPIIIDTHSVISMQAEIVNAGKGAKKAQITVNVRDNAGNPVSGVTVSGDFSPGSSYTETVSKTTDDSGNAVLISTDTAKGTITYEFCIQSLSAISNVGTSWDKITPCVSFP